MATVTEAASKPPWEAAGKPANGYGLEEDFKLQRPGVDVLKAAGHVIPLRAQCYQGFLPQLSMQGHACRHLNPLYSQGYQILLRSRFLPPWLDSRRASRPASSGGARCPDQPG